MLSLKGAKLRFLHFIWVLILFAATIGNAYAQDLTAVSVIETSDATQVVLSFDAPARKADKMFFTTEGAPRLVLDYKASDYQVISKGNRVDGQGLVDSVRFARRGKSEQDMRLVLDLNVPDVRPTPLVSGNTLTLILKNAASSQTIETSPATLDMKKSPNPSNYEARYFGGKIPYPRLKPRGQSHSPPKPQRKPVIVIDPGHGGRDPGAIGVAGTQEKKITHAASLALKKQLLATGRYQVIITRDKDVYVAHEERLRIARAGGADLFISIHADATASGTARGASVYTLADRALDRSKRIVNSQNWIMDVDLSEQSDPVGDILVDLAQRKTATQSDEFAEVLISELANSTHLIGNTHRRAGYFVLLAPDVPAVLLELGFLSNAQDETLLNNAAHRKKLVSSVTRAINIYFDKQKS